MTPAAANEAAARTTSIVAVDGLSDCKSAAFEVFSHEIQGL